MMEFLSLIWDESFSFDEKTLFSIKVILSENIFALEMSN